jgi:predicted DCC family thiol-disulfide oxidoreductase YuxK
MNENPIILFDGVCNFCNGAVNFIIKHDRKKAFRFTPLQSDAGQALLQQYGLPTNELKSFVLIEKGKAYKKTTAALRVANYFSPYWRWTNLFWILPSPVRDVAYNIIAKYRYKWFGKKEECMIPSSEFRSRFL